MRETTFRAQEATKGAWRYGDYFSQFKDGETKHYIVEHPYGRGSGREIMWEIKPDTRSEYTGLKDKNGVEIYEGDVVLDHNASLVGKGRHIKVKWRQGLAGFAPFCEHQAKDGDPVMSDGEFGVEVIGNIYENPDLLAEAA